VHHHTGHLACTGRNPLDRRFHVEFDTRRLRMPGQGACETMGIARFVRARVITADQQ